MRSLVLKVTDWQFRQVCEIEHSSFEGFSIHMTGEHAIKIQFDLHSQFGRSEIASWRDSGQQSG